MSQKSKLQKQSKEKDQASHAAFRVTVPATTANLGPGFDCLGMALNLRNAFKITLLPDSAPGHEVIGRGACAGLTSPKNPFFEALNSVFEDHAQTAPKLRVEIDGKIPMARGLGSSATAIVAGVIAADMILKLDSGLDDLLLRMSRLEGHPDNVTPAFLGGLTCSLEAEERVLYGLAEPHPDWRVVAVIPSYELSTKKARQVLPAKISRQDAVFNMARIPFLFDALCEGEEEHLSELMQDRIHQPYRKTLIRGWDELMAAATNAGAAGAYLSGAGPTFATFCLGTKKAKTVAAALTRAISPHDSQAQIVTLKPDTTGALAD